MENIQAAGSMLNIALLDAAMAKQDGLLYFLIGNNAQSSALRILIETLRHDRHRHMYDFPFVIDSTMDKGTLEVWCFANRQVAHVATIYSLAIPYGFSQ